MPRYHYTAIAEGGKKVKGSITAESPYAARKQLRTRSIHPSSITQSDSTTLSKTAIGSIFKKRNKNQVSDFTKQLSTLLNSGIKLTEALSVLTLQVADMRFKQALTDIRDRVVTGESFTDSLGDYTDFFDPVYISMVRVGEVTGTLSQSLSTIAGFMEKRRKVESKVITAMIYPLVLILFCIVAILILTIKVIPTIGEQIIRAGQKLPLVTRGLLGVSHVMTSWWLIVVIIAIAGIVFIMKKILRTNRGAYLRDKLILSAPVFGPLIKQRVAARFASTLSTLLGSGLSIAESLKVVAEVTGNSLMKKALHQARERILAGADIATPLQDSGIIDPAMAHMVAVGEKSGELETMLKNISDNLESSTDVVIERLSTAVEPLIIITMSVIVGIIAYATILPILKISSLNF
jgi:general secretion pathway protein F